MRFNTTITKQSINQLLQFNKSTSISTNLKHYISVFVVDVLFAVLMDILAWHGQRGQKVVGIRVHLSDFLSNPPPVCKHCQPTRFCYFYAVKHLEIISLIY